LARVLHSTLIKITMTFDDKWTLGKEHLRINLRRAGFIVSEENIILATEELSGPNKNLQGKIISFYVKHTSRCIVPVLGCIDQISSKGQQIITIGQDSKDVADAEVERMAQPIYFSLEPLSLTEDEIRAVMADRKSKKAKEDSES